MYYIQRNGEPATTTDPNEVTKENFLVEPGGENRVWVKLTKHEFDQRTGEKKMLVNQINSLNPGDYEFCVRNWRQNEITIEMLHDPRPEQKGDGVEDKLAKLKAKMGDNQGENENENENGENPTEENWKKTVEAKEAAEKRAAELEAELAEMKAKADDEARAAFEAQERAKAEEESKAKAEEEARLKAEEEAKAESKGEKKSSK